MRKKGRLDVWEDLKIRGKGKCMARVRSNWLHQSTGMNERGKRLKGLTMKMQAKEKTTQHLRTKVV
jgi:hypothetical protein